MRPQLLRESEGESEGERGKMRVKNLVRCGDWVRNEGDAERQAGEQYGT